VALEPSQRSGLLKVIVPTKGVAFGRIASATRQDATAEGAQLLGCILMPSDGMVLFLFRAPNEGWVKDQSRLSEVPFDRIVESVQIGLDHQPS